MKYETLKTRVAGDVYAKVRRAHDIGSPGDAMAAILLDAIAEKRPPRASAEALAERCLQIVMAWDIRQVGKLRELFPQFFPASLSKGPLVCDMDEAGDWCVLRAPE